MRAVLVPLPCVLLAATAAAQCGLEKLYVPGGEQFDRLSTAAIDGPLAVVGAPGAGLGPNSEGQAFVYSRAITGWQLDAELTPGDPQSYGGFGGALDVGGDTIVVGANRTADLGVDSGSAYVFELGPGGWTQTAKLLAADGVAKQLFGTSVALEDDCIAVGAPGLFLSGFTGAVYLFERQPGGAWVQTQKLLASDAEVEDGFGISVSLDAGPRLLVGANAEDGAGVNRGAAYVFEESGGGWAETAKLTHPNPADYDLLGRSVSLSGDTALVGAWAEDAKGKDSGSAHVFELGPGGWAHTAELLPTTLDPEDEFGTSVALDGDRALVGAPHDDNASTFNPGKAYLFERSGGVWDGGTRIYACDVVFLKHSEFGRSVALQGDVLLVGDPHDSDLAFEAGSVQAFTSGLDSPPLTCALTGCYGRVSVSAGGEEPYQLIAGPGHGGELFLLLGSASGHAPGLVVDGVAVPLNPADAYFLHTLSMPNQAPLIKSLGTLGPGGTGQGQFKIVAGLAPPAVVGLQFVHAFVTVDATPAVAFASNWTTLDLVP